MGGLAQRQSDGPRRYPGSGYDRDQTAGRWFESFARPLRPRVCRIESRIKRFLITPSNVSHLVNSGTMHTVVLVDL